MIPVCSLNELSIFRPDARTRDLARRLECSEVTAAVLGSRESGEDVLRQLLSTPDLQGQLADLDMGRAAEAARALWQRSVPEKKVFVYGDYDVDGVSSTVLAMELAQQSGAASVTYYIPDRQAEGYGLHRENMRRILADGFDCLIVVDCGSKDVEAVEMAKSAGLNVIIFDHHSVEGDVVSLESFINPQVDGDEESKKLCATAVLWCWAWKARLISEARLADLLQLVALATVSDCMPLGPLNRALAREGMKMMRRRPRRGLAELIHALCPTEPDALLDENRLAMRIIPCLNAAGRVQVADVAVNVLYGRGSDLELQRSVEELLSLNRKRRDISMTICNSINVGLENGEESQVLYNGGWPVGILSAIASRLCSEHNKAFALAAPSGSGIRGTLRVPDGANAVELLSRLDGLLEGWGGHRSAAGFSVDQLKWPRVAKELNSMLTNIKVEKAREEVILFDPGQIGRDDWGDVLRIGPFGNGNPSPAFFAPMDPDVTYMPLGKKGLHARVLIGGSALIAFNGAQQLESTQGIRGWIYKPRLNLWQGRMNLQFIVERIVVA